MTVSLKNVNLGCRINPIMVTATGQINLTVAPHSSGDILSVRFR